MNNSLKKTISWILVFIWLIVIFMFSSMDSNESNNKSERIINKVLETTINTTNNLGMINNNLEKNTLNEYTLSLNLILRKCMHAFVYFILSLLLLNALNISSVKNKKIYLLTLVICFIYSLIDECHQTFVDGRNGTFMDSFIDTFGSIIGIIFYYYLFKILRKHHKIT